MGTQFGGTLRKHVDLCDFEAGLVSIVSSRSARSAQRDPVSNMSGCVCVGGAGWGVGVPWSSPALALGAGILDIEHIPLSSFSFKRPVFHFFPPVPKYVYNRGYALGAQICTQLEPPPTQPVLLSSNQPHFEVELSGKIKINCP